MACVFTAMIDLLRIELALPQDNVRTLGRKRRRLHPGIQIMTVARVAPATSSHSRAP